MSSSASASGSTRQRRQQPKEQQQQQQQQQQQKVAGGLTREQIHEYYEAFCMYDHDKSGSIDTSELAHIMASMGQNVKEEDVEAMLDKVDTDGSGNIDFAEFVSLMENHINKPVTKEEIRSAFMVFDTMKKGYVTADELRRVLTTRGDRMTLEEANEMIAAADLDGDGLIDYAEFSAALVDLQ